MTDVCPTVEFKKGKLFVFASKKDKEGWKKEEIQKNNEPVINEIYNELREHIDIVFAKPNPNKIDGFKKDLKFLKKNVGGVLVELSFLRKHEHDKQLNIGFPVGKSSELFKISVKKGGKPKGFFSIKKGESIGAGTRCNSIQTRCAVLKYILERVNYVKSTLEED